MSPITGPMVDRIGRKKAAMLYCLLEMFINGLEQYPYLPGLVASRMIGGFTTNLLCQVFETWLDTEYRLRGLAKEKYEIIMRDSVIVSNLAAILSGYLAHVLAEWYGAKGPFRGAVCCTGIALSVVGTIWTENYGSQEGDDVKNMADYFREAVAAFRADSRMLRVGAVQGLTAGSIQIFIFLWAPALRALSRAAHASTAGLDSQGEPAYGLIFGSFMAAGVLGGVLAPLVRRAVSRMLSPITDTEEDSIEIVEVDGEEVEVRPMAVEFLAAFCYMVSALLLLVPFAFNGEASDSFSVCLAAFLVFELLIGVFLPCEGVIRSLYFPATARASVMSLPRIIVNGAVSVGVASTNFIRYVRVANSSCILSFSVSLNILLSVTSLETAFAAVATMMLVSASLQLSLISSREWSSLWSRVLLAGQQASSLLPQQFVSRGAAKVKHD
jgi:MFS transporter, MFS domain-containing protein family, molybdate-anion transporter